LNRSAVVELGKASASGTGGRSSAWAKYRPVLLARQPAARRLAVRRLAVRRLAAQLVLQARQPVVRSPVQPARQPVVRWLVQPAR
jgi:hypothetical protein